VTAVGLCVAATALLKIYLYACPPAPDLVSPSGHSSLSVLIYGAIALVIAAQHSGWLRAVILVAGASPIVAILPDPASGSTRIARPRSLLRSSFGIATLALFAAHYLKLSNRRKMAAAVHPVGDCDCRDLSRTGTPR
jgi:hypothetical protein